MRGVQAFVAESSHNPKRAWPLQGGAVADWKTAQGSMHASGQRMEHMWSVEALSDTPRPRVVPVSDLSNRMLLEPRDVDEADAIDLSACVQSADCY